MDTQIDTLGSRLKKLREDKELTLEYVANKIGTTKVSIGRYEKDTREPKGEMLKTLAKFYDVSVDYLLNGSNAITPHSNDWKSELTKKDKINIEKEAKKMIDNLDKVEIIEFCGHIADDEDKEYFKLAYERFLTDVRIYNKQKYTPNRYKK